jgi:hypothetical protein
MQHVTLLRVFSWEAIYDNARSASHIVPFKQLFHQLMRFGHPSGRHERECQEALTVGRRVQPARRPRQGKRIAWTIHRHTARHVPPHAAPRPWLPRA